MVSLKNVRDDELLRQLCRLVKESRGVEAEVVAHIAEVERRRLYAQEGCSSMFEYCRRVLGLRENEAYLRITVARAARENPVLLEMLGDGRLHLSGMARLAPHLTRENAEAVLQRASGMSHREIRELVAEVEPRPDVAPSVRKLPERPVPASGSSHALGCLGSSRALGCLGSSKASSGLVDGLELGAPRVESDAVNPRANLEIDRPAVNSEVDRKSTSVAPIRPRDRPAVVEPLAPARYQVRFTASAELREKLERLQALMRSSVPDGDLGRIIDIAISEKLERVEARRFGQTKAPRTDLADADTSPSSRHIPAAVRRRVHARDGGRCAYRDRHGVRCGKRHDLEFHHKHPFGRGGDHSPANLTLMCKTHNLLVAEQDYGEEVIARFRAATTQAAAPGRAGLPVAACGARIVVRPRGISSG